MCDPLRVLQGKLLAAKFYKRCCQFCKKPFLGTSRQLHCSSKCREIKQALKVKVARELRNIGKPKRDMVAVGKKLSSTRIKKNCTVCGELFSASYRGLVCSDKCAWKANYARINSGKVKLTTAERAERMKTVANVCETCDKPFKGTYRQRFCNAQCYKVSRRMKVKNIPCLYCSNLFMERQAGLKKKYCSLICKDTDRAEKLKRGVITIVCDNCQTPFKTEGKCEKRKKYCSDFCQRVTSARRSYYRDHPTEYLTVMSEQLSKVLSNAPRGN